MVKIIKLTKEFDLPPQGTFVDKFDTIVDEDCDCYKPDGSILFKFRKNVIPDDQAKHAIKVFKSHAKKKNDNRGYASGLLPGGRAKQKDARGMSRGNISQSQIAGYYDKPMMQHKKHLGTDVACRTTAFNKHKAELFDTTIPFFKTISDTYKDLAPEHYGRQKDYIDGVIPEMKIKDTVFTTITLNYNWRTACHYDAGDYDKGLGNLTVVGDDQYEGGCTGFPRYGVGVNLRNKDVVIMDVHEMHCNTPLTPLGDAPMGERLSFVCYVRKNMARCTQNVKEIGNFTYYTSNQHA